MRFISFETENFRMLRDIKFDFSLNPDKPVTVIRAENETGKTTLWRAIAWCLHGETYLKKLNKYWLTPKSWIDEGRGNTCTIRVSLEFSVEVESEMGLESNKKYLLSRTVKERYLESERSFTPIDKSSIELFEFTDDGLTPVTPAYANNLIRTYFPIELIDIFLLNGDTMESQMFSSLKKQKAARTTVEDFLNKAMDVEIYKEAVKHSKAVRSRTLSRLGDGADGDEAQIASDINEVTGKLDKIEVKIDASKEKIENITEERDRLKREIDNAQEEGNREDLLKKKEDLETEQNQEIERQLKNAKSMAQNFSSKKFAIDCLTEKALKPFKIRISELEEEGVVPRQTVPFLERIIEKDENCICGDLLSEKNYQGEIRSDHISQEIEKSKEQDSTSALLTDLNHKCLEMNIWVEENINKWVDSQESYQAEIIDAIDKSKEIGDQIRDIDNQLDDVSETDVAALRVSREEKISDLNDEEGILETLKFAEMNNNRTLSELEVKLEKLLDEKSQNTSINAQLDLISDSLDVFTELLEILQNDKSKLVSSEMNGMFLGMTGSEDENIGPIKSVEITDERDVVVTTKEGMKFSPRDNLNGASLRALTLSFVLALCKESGKSLPHVIDTPFGMTSGVRDSMLEVAINNAEQLILCLTPSEIRGLEKILMECNDPDYSYSITWSAHYPQFVKNEISEIEQSVRCECSFLDWCDKCDRLKWDEKQHFDKEYYSELSETYN